MMRRCLLAVAIAVLIAGSAMFAQEQRGAVQNGPIEFSFTINVGSCFGGPGAGGFDILNDATFAARHSMTVYNEQGLPMKDLTNWKFPRSKYYNSEDPNRALWSGPGENQLTIDWYGYNEKHEWVLVYATSAGLITRVVVPGHGPIYMETGAIVFEPPSWRVLHNAGHNQLYDGDWQVLCNYLK